MMVTVKVAAAGVGVEGARHARIEELRAWLRGGRLGITGASVKGFDSGKSVID